MNPIEGQVNLSQCEQGEVSHVLDSPLQPRLIELGFIQGREVKVIRRSDIFQHLMVQVNGQVFGLRYEEAALIIIAS